MKKVAFILVVSLTFIIASCSKESRINYRLDGEWKAIIIDGDAVQEWETIEFKFIKGKKNIGDVTYTESNSFGNITRFFSYSLSENVMTLIDPSNSETIILTIKEYTRKKIEWVSSDGEKTILESK